MTALDPARWERLARLFEEAADFPAESLAGWLDAAVGDDAALRAELAAMLAADRGGASLIDEGVAPTAGLLLDPEPPLAPGDAVGEFDVIGQLAEGGMGIVYEARDRHLGRLAALKFLPEGLPDADARAERLIAEAKAASALDHPNVATIWQVGVDGQGRRFIAMPRYEGETLHARLARGALEPAEALRIAREVAAGLAAAHRAGIVHRDVTPGNIFLSAQGTTKLLDFGIAALAGDGGGDEVARGTASCMSPEQARGEPADARSDVWSLGVVLYRMLAGEAPFPGAGTAEVLARVRSAEPSPRLSRRRDVPGALARVVDRALQKDPRARFADAGEMLAALEAAARPVKSRAGRAIGGAVLVALAAIALAVGSPAPGPSGEAPPPPPGIVFREVTSSGGPPEALALAGGVVEEVSARLSALGRVRVVTAAGATPGPGGAEVIVTVADTGAGVRLDAEVHRPGRADPAWTGGWPFSRARLPTVSRSLAAAIMRAVGVELTAREQSALAGSLPRNVPAYEAFLEGNRLVARRTPDAALAALEQYREAHRRDSAYVPALARQAYTISLLLDWGWRDPARTREMLLEEGRRVSEEALALDSVSAEAWLARAYLLMAADPHRLAGAPEAFQRSIALDPYNAEAFHQYGQALMVLGRWGEAMTAYRRATELDPGSAMSLIGMAGLADLAGQREETVRLVDAAVAAAPEMAFAHAIRALLSCFLGEYTAARAQSERALTLDSAFTVPAHAVLAMARKGLGDVAGADESLGRALAAVEDPGAPTPDEAFFLAHAQLALGRLDEAVSLVERVRPRGATLWYLFQQPAFAEFRRHPRVAAVLAGATPQK